MMEFRYSEHIDSKMYETHGLCDGIELRIHKDPHGEIKGALRCQRDWAKLVAPVNQPFWGTLGDPYSFVRVTIPETLPERLEILSYANEFAFIYDGNSFCPIRPEDLADVLPSRCNHGGHRPETGRALDE